jgi:AcrR family transcriptional regulator
VVSSKLFRVKGFAATTTREVSKLAGMQNASLYYHVKSKEELLFLLCRESLDHITREVESAIAGTAVADKVRTLIHAHVTTMMADVDQHATMLMELRSLRGRNRTEIIKRRDRYEAVVQQVIEESQGGGFLRSDVAARHLCWSLLNLMNWSIFWFDARGDLQPSQWADILTEVFLGGAQAPSLHTAKNGAVKKNGTTKTIGVRSRRRTEGPSADGTSVPKRGTRRIL